MMSKIIILGAGGFIGTALCNKLSQASTTVVAVGSKLQHLPKNVEKVEQRITDFNILNDYVSEGSTVFYLLNNTSPAYAQKNPSADVRDNLALFIDYLIWAKDKNIHTLYSSSGGTVYGACSDIPLKEDSAPLPISFYGMGKLSAERYLEMFGRLYNIDYTICRISNPYGPGQSILRAQGLIPNILNNLVNNHPTPIIGKGDAVRDYIYISDLIDGLSSCISNEKTYGEVLNFGTGQGYSVLEVISAIEVATQQSVLKEYLPSRQLDVPVNVLSIKKAKSLLNWTPQIRLVQGLQKTIEHIYPQL